jgi:transcriptional regulator with XRE-family HTH domain
MPSCSSIRGGTGEPRSTSSPSPVGALLQYWRKLRRLSQLALAEEAGVSPRHLCFLETGRARPSREMVLHLAAALDVPLRERNALLVAAGFAPTYGELNLAAPELAPARAALDAILQQQEPYPAVVMNRHWDILTANRAAARFFAFLLGDTAPDGPANVVRLIFSPNGLRPFVANWAAVAEALIGRVHREAVGHVVDAATARLLREVLTYPDVPARWRTPSLEQPSSPIVPVIFEKATLRFEYFSTVTTLGTPQDVTLQEIRVECFFPVDAQTERNARSLAARQ